MRLIDAEKLKEELLEPPLHNSLCGMSTKDVIDIVNDAPTIEKETVAVAHGYWKVKVIEADSEYTRDVESVYCGVCGHWIQNGNKTPYCPYCGAKMDGE